MHCFKSQIVLVLAARPPGHLLPLRGRVASSLQAAAGALFPSNGGAACAGDMGVTVAPSSPPAMAHPRPLESGRQQAGGQATSDPVSFLLTDGGNTSLFGEPASSPAVVAQGQGAYALLEYSFLHC
jgi:hypothetical protein